MVGHGESGRVGLVQLAGVLVGNLHVLFDIGRADDGVFDVVGPICESSDVFGKRRKLPAASAPGDVVLIADAGAYGFTMANAYNLRALPKEEVLDV